MAVGANVWWRWLASHAVPVGEIPACTNSHGRVLTDGAQQDGFIIPVHREL